jgi:hypothetical protein
MCHSTFGGFLLPYDRIHGPLSMNISAKARVLAAGITLYAQPALAGVGAPQARETASVSSPDGRLRVTVRVDPEFSYSVRYAGEDLILESPLGLEFADQPPLGPGLAIRQKETMSADDTYAPEWGPQKQISDRCNELAVALAESSPPGRYFQIIVRAYDNGVAFRYVLPRQPGLESFTLTKERTGFLPAGSPRCWAADFESFHSHQEAAYPSRKWSEMTAGPTWGVPVVMQFDDSVFAAITEAHLQDWAGMYLGIDRARLGRLLYASGPLGSGDSSIPIDVSIEGMSTLHLLTEPVATLWCENTLWAGARVLGKSESVKYLSELKPLSFIQPVEKDRRPDKAPLRLGGRSFERGLGTVARNVIGFKLDRKFSRFQAEIGVDTGQTGTHRARFEVYASSTVDSGFQGLVATLSPLPGTNGRQLVRASTPHQSPWRVLLVGKTPGSLIESTLIESLNPPPAFEDRSWIRPGIVQWDHWWSGDTKMDTETIKSFIAFAGENRLPYHLIDAGWYGDFDRPEADVTSVIPALAMDEIRRFAAEKNVKLWLWVHWSDLDRKLEEAFALYESWGIVGVKVDYMQRDDQEMVRWYERVVRAAANHRLMVDFHGAYKGTGEQRTWPNLMTREGVLGNEWNKWSRDATPEHNVTIPFTRMLTGPMDYTPLGFLNRTPAAFVPTSPTQVQTTRAHQLAMLIVYETPIVCICDLPEHYRGQPGFDFVPGLPTTWDESRVPSGAIGEHIAMARRSGRSWYLGVMNGAGKRTVKVPLEFLGAGTYTMRIFADAPDAATNPERVAESTQEVRSDERYTFTCAPGGGAVARFDPVP